MNFTNIIDHDILVWVVIPILIFFAGLAYVSLGTLRIIFIARGRRFLSPLLGFFEVSIWLVAISQIMSSVSNIAAYIGYAAGFAVGNYVGIIIEEKMAIGILAVRIILTDDDDTLKKKISAAGFGVTAIDGHGINNKVQVIFTVVRRKDLKQVISIINESHASAFYSVEDARQVSNSGLLKR